MSVERRHSTWIDHPLTYDVSGASHFPGSAALLGHVVPLAVEGWSDETLTEDLALTLRLYLEVKAGRELEVQELVAEDGEVTAEGIGKHAISFVAFYCDEGPAQDATDDFPSKGRKGQK